MASSSKFAVIERLSDRYEILQPIGQPFGYQQVLANDMHRRCSVVIKSLDLEENTPTGDICCFEREIHLLEFLSHPTIPRYLDSFTVDTPKGKGLILVQSHNGGNTLAQQVATGHKFGESELKEIAKQLLQGLVYLHRKGLVHRDIKPSNLVGHRSATGSHKPGQSSPGQSSPGQSSLGQVAWLNLGTAQYIQAQRNDALVGTYGYMPPEQVGGQATFASDLYSLGATLIYLATGYHLGELPRHGHKAKFTCSPEQISPSFQQWLNWLIEPDVSDRPRSAQQALAALNNLPLAMFKRRLWQPAKAPMLPVPIKSSGPEPYQPFFTQIKSAKKRRSLELVVPPVGMRACYLQRVLPPLLMGTALLSMALYLIGLLDFSLERGSGGLVSLIASLAAASLGAVGGCYSLRFFQSGFSLLGTYLLRQVYIQLESDVLLIAYKYWLRSPVYVVNTRREDIYSISAMPDGRALRILTHRNRTQVPTDCYKLTLADGALSYRDIRWLNSLLNDWRRQPGSCTQG
jgi:serine/threonine protein kinase